MHAVCGFPVKSTWLKAVKAGNYIGWPLITMNNVTKYYPETIKTPKGHLNQTKKTSKAPSRHYSLSKSPMRRLCGVRNSAMCSQKCTCTMSGKKNSHQTGKFPKKSQRGNKYLMVMVEIDSNAILVEPLKIRKDSKLTRAYHVLVMRLKNAGIVPRKHVLNNEVSQAMKEVIRDK
jgi:hypothetical protein